MSSSDSVASDKRMRTAGIVLGIFGAIGIAVIVYWVAHMKKRVSAHSSPASAEGGYAFPGFGTGKPAGQTAKGAGNRVTPFSFGANGDGPVYEHTPGTNMRIAARHPNGIWTFHETDPHTADPNTPNSTTGFVPRGIHDPAPQPTTPTSAHSLRSGPGGVFSFEPVGYSGTSTRRKKSVDFLGNYHSNASEASMALTLPALPSPTQGINSPVTPLSVAPRTPAATTPTTASSSQQGYDHARYGW